ncbi:MAG TPA: ScyD/ScyE family protein [Cyanobacteria bacterium UBA11369]|nr:ScyD/ScyE family protein [Cyanobacteria bacterium UBA11369]
MKLKPFTLTFLTFLIATGFNSKAAIGASLKILADGLNNARGLTFDSNGNLYVTEAGLGGQGACIPSPTNQGNLCYGTTGAVTKIENGKTERILTGLPSIALADGSGAAGPNDIEFDANGKPYILIGYGANPALRDPAFGNAELGKIIAANFETNTWKTIADLANYELANNPDRADIGSNPLAFLIDGKQAIAVDAGANNLLGVATDGSDLEDFAVLPQQILTNPIFPPSDAQPFDPTQVPSPGNFGNAPPSGFPVQATPTGVAKGPDGAYYVSIFTGFPFPEGGAKIYRIGADKQPTIYADNFTQLTNLTFDPQGNLYALQYANQSAWKGNFDGSVIKISPQGTRTTLFSGNGLEAPSSLTIGPDGAIYVTNRSDRPGQGQVLRIENPKSVPEPTSVLSILTLGILGVTRLRKSQLIPNRRLG